MYYEDPKTGQVVIIRHVDRVRNSVNEQEYNFERILKEGTPWQKKNAATQLRILKTLRAKLNRLKKLHRKRPASKGGKSFGKGRFWL